MKQVGQFHLGGDRMRVKNAGMVKKNMLDDMESITVRRNREWSVEVTASVVNNKGLLTICRAL